MALWPPGPFGLAMHDDMGGREGSLVGKPHLGRKEGIEELAHCQTCGWEGSEKEGVVVGEPGP